MVKRTRDKGHLKRQSLGSYDRFFSSNSRPTRVQFWGLIILGGNLVVLGTALLFAVLSKTAKPPLDSGEGMILLFGVGISGSIIWFGVFHINRAFAGQNDKTISRD